MVGADWVHLGLAAVSWEAGWEAGVMGEFGLRCLARQAALTVVDAAPTLALACAGCCVRC